MARGWQRWATWALVWAVTRFLTLVQIGFWNDQVGAEYQDVDTYRIWSDWIVSTGSLPEEASWQYPPGAAFLFLLPRLGPLDFKPSFIALMLVFDLIGLALMARLAGRERSDVGVWIWLLAMPLLSTMPILRFDMVPTVIAVAALVALHRRPAWLGALAGLGASIKVWPAVVLLGEWDRRRLRRSAVAAALTVAGIFLIAWVAFGDQTGFFANQKDRGLQVEAVAATPWQARALINGKEPPVVQRFGTNEIGSDLGDAVATALDFAGLLVLVAAALWWWLRDRAIRNGRSDLADEVLSRDFVFAVVLWLVVASRVLSPQFMVWMVGVAGVVLTAGRTRLARPAWIVIGAVILTAGLYQSPLNFIFRNGALLIAAVDAAWILARAVLDRAEKDLGPSPEEPPGDGRERPLGRAAASA